MSQISNGQKKVKLIGKVIIVTSIWTVIIVALLNYLYLSFILTLSSPDYVAFSQVEGVSDPIPTRLITAYWEGVDVNEVLDFIRERKGFIVFNSLLNASINIALSLLMMIIGFSWRKGELLGKQVIGGIKWISFICLGISIYSFLKPTFSTAVDRSALSHDALYALTVDVDPHLGTFYTGLILLALSYILKYSNQLEEEVSLTV